MFPFKMQISSIKISGFKSYTQPVELRNLSFFNAITGLNGSGKSNILDAILFAMAFDSHLRVKKLTDLINTQSYEAVVTLEFTTSPPKSNKNHTTGAKENKNQNKKEFNANKQASNILASFNLHAHSTIVITRSIDKNNKMRISFNNTNCTLKTIRTFFGAFNLFPSSFSIVLQGSITKILDKSINDLLLQTSGLKHYETQKQNALSLILKKEQKLLDTKQNLTKIISPFFSKLKNERLLYLQYQNYLKTADLNEKLLFLIDLVLEYNSVVRKCKEFFAELNFYRSLIDEIAFLESCSAKGDDLFYVLSCVNEKVSVVDRLKTSVGLVENEIKETLHEIENVIKDFHSTKKNSNDNERNFNNIIDIIDDAFVEKVLNSKEYLNTILQTKKLQTELNLYQNQEKLIGGNKTQKDAFDSNETICNREKEMENLKIEKIRSENLLANIDNDLKSISFFDIDFSDLSNFINNVEAIFNSFTNLANNRKVDGTDISKNTNNSFGNIIDKINIHNVDINTFFSVSSFNIQKQTKNLLKTQNFKKNTNSANNLVTTIDDHITLFTYIENQLEDLQKIQKSISSLARKLDYPVIDGVHGKLMDNFTVKDERYREAVNVVLSSKMSFVIVENEDVGSAVINECGFVVPISRIKTAYNRNTELNIKKHLEKKRKNSSYKKELSESRNRCDDGVLLDRVNGNGFGSHGDKHNNGNMQDQNGVNCLDLIMCSEKTKKAFEFACGNYYIFDNKEDAKEICYKFKVYSVTLDGLLYDPRGLIYGGKSYFKKSDLVYHKIFLLNELFAAKKMIVRRIFDIIKTSKPNGESSQEINLMDDRRSVPGYNSTTHNRNIIDDVINIYTPNSEENMLQTENLDLCKEQIKAINQKYAKHKDLSDKKELTLENLKNCTTTLNLYQQNLSTIDKNKKYLEIVQKISIIRNKITESQNISAKINEDCLKIKNLHNKKSEIAKKIATNDLELDDLLKKKNELEIEDSKSRVLEAGERSNEIKKEELVEKKVKCWNKVRKIAAYLVENAEKIECDQVEEKIIQILSTNEHENTSHNRKPNDTASLNNSNHNENPKFNPTNRDYASKRRRDPDLNNGIGSLSINNNIVNQKETSSEDQFLNRSGMLEELKDHKNSLETKNGELQNSNLNIDSQNFRISEIKEFVLKNTENNIHEINTHVDDFKNADLKFIPQITFQKISDLSKQNHYTDTMDELLKLKKMEIKNQTKIKEKPKMNPKNFALLEKNEEIINNLEVKIKKCETDKIKIIKGIEKWNSKSKKEFNRALEFLNAECSRFLRCFIPNAEIQFLCENSAHNGANKENSDANLIEDDARKDKNNANKRTKHSLEFTAHLESSQKQIQIQIKIGQKRANIKELSGGQRSIIALSIILTMLKYKPAPFYLFDEIDSALDEQFTAAIGEAFGLFDAQFMVVSLKDGLYSCAESVYQVIAEKDKTSVAKIR